ncbi:hypothetical protein QBC42DRAFT_29163 [Cladorrhinum samala]|uniref:Secreted protein n=1 Tax=Cladorrhinum samala TaxID=585594 RepID=A0AAV9HX67_9PEZI|nr:hypothetical protein QBC42DRAFT_29163 [Cladorrhinum samala]
MKTSMLALIATAVSGALADTWLACGHMLVNSGSKPPPQSTFTILHISIRVHTILTQKRLVPKRHRPSRLRPVRHVRRQGVEHALRGHPQVVGPERVD